MWGHRGRGVRDKSHNLTPKKVQNSLETGFIGLKSLFAKFLSNFCGKLVKALTRNR